jgi:hypothetical protein
MSDEMKCFHQGCNTTGPHTHFLPDDQMSDFLKNLQYQSENKININPHGVKTEIVICHDEEQGVSVKECEASASECKCCSEFAGIDTEEQL